MFFLKKIKLLEVEINNLRNTLSKAFRRIVSIECGGVIGEYFYKYTPQQFIKFSAADITDEKDDNIRIHGAWVNKSLIFYYDDVHQDTRREIRAKENSLKDI